MRALLGKLERSWLFVPGDRPERFDKALASGADGVILDLEDAVAPERKKIACEAVLSALDSKPAHSFWVRASGRATDFNALEMQIMRHPSIVGVMVPKTDTAYDIDGYVALCRDDAGCIALIETARGVSNLPAIAQARGLTRMCMGNLDLLHDLNASSERVVNHVLITLAITARTAGLPPPIAGVTPQLGQPALLDDESRTAVALGCFGKPCIHPQQIAAVHSAHAPDEARVAWAHEIVALARGGAVFHHEGQMVDASVIRMAENVLRLPNRT
jgi:citrate lyase subunit beta/citryl-CoA lyase